MEKSFKKDVKFTYIGNVPKILNLKSTSFKSYFGH